MRGERGAVGTLIMPPPSDAFRWLPLIDPLWGTSVDAVPPLRRPSALSGEKRREPSDNVETNVRNLREGSPESLMGSLGYVVNYGINYSGGTMRVRSG